MKKFVFALLLSYSLLAFANTECPTSVPHKPGYLTTGDGFNITPLNGKYYSQSLSELARMVETITEEAHPGWDLVLNSPKFEIRLAEP